MHIIKDIFSNISYSLICLRIGIGVVVSLFSSAPPCPCWDCTLPLALELWETLPLWVGDDLKIIIMNYSQIYTPKPSQNDVREGRKTSWSRLCPLCPVLNLYFTLILVGVVQLPSFCPVLNLEITLILVVVVQLPSLCLVKYLVQSSGKGIDWRTKTDYKPKIRKLSKTYFHYLYVSK